MIYALVFGAMINIETPTLQTCLQLRATAVQALEQKSELGLMDWCPDVMQVVCRRIV